MDQGGQVAEVMLNQDVISVTKNAMPVKFYKKERHVRAQTPKKDTRYTRVLHVKAPLSYTWVPAKSA